MFFCNKVIQGEVLITSNYIINLSEKYSDSVKVFNNLALIFENPNRDDLVEMVKNAKFPEIRFLAKADAPQTCYMWNGGFALHDDIRKHLHFPVEGETTPGIVDGEASVLGGAVKNAKIIYLAEFLRDSGISNSYGKDNRNLLRKMLSYNWSWLDRYVPGCSSQFNHCKEEFKSIDKKFPGI